MARKKQQLPLINFQNMLTLILIIASIVTSFVIVKAATAQNSEDIKVNVEDIKNIEIKIQALERNQDVIKTKIEIIEKNTEKILDKI